MNWYYRKVEESNFMGFLVGRFFPQMTSNTLYSQFFSVLIIPLPALSMSSFVSRKKDNQSQITAQNENTKYFTIVLHFDQLFKETFIL